jgi:hypothetical protein
MTDPSDFIDADEGHDFPSPFYAEALPCESCGEPTYKARVWNQEYQLMVAVDCSCNEPDEPVCPGLLPLIEQAKTVGELMDRVKAHRKLCVQCGAPIPFPNSKPRRKEPAMIERQAA